MALATKLSLALLLLGSIGFAYLGPAPRRHVGARARGTLLGSGLLGYCAAGWLGRGEAPPSDDDGDDGGGGGGGRRPKPPPTDWDAFERAFRQYARERERQRV